MFKGLKRKREDANLEDEFEVKRKTTNQSEQKQGSGFGAIVYSTLVQLASTIGIAGAKDFARFTSKGLQSQLSQKSSSYINLQESSNFDTTPEETEHNISTSLMSPTLFDRSTSPRGSSPFSLSILKKPMQTFYSDRKDEDVPSSSPPEVKTSLRSLHALRRKSAIVAAFKAEKESQNSLIILPKNVPFPELYSMSSTLQKQASNASLEKSSLSTVLLLQEDKEDKEKLLIKVPLIDSEMDTRIERARSALFEALAPAARDRESVLKYIDDLIHTSTANSFTRLKQEPLAVSSPVIETTKISSRVALSSTVRPSATFSPTRSQSSQPSIMNLMDDDDDVAVGVTQKNDDIIDLLDDNDDDVSSSSLVVKQFVDPLQQRRAVSAQMDLIISRYARENAIRSNLTSKTMLSDDEISRLASCLFPFQDQEELLQCCPGGPLGIAGRVSKDSVTWRSIQCLVDGEWLNDEVINFEARRISLQVRASGIWVTSSHFYSKLAESAPFGTPKGTSPGYSFENVKRWTEKEEINIRKLKCVILPLHVLPVHWAVLMINLQMKSIHYYDSLFAPRFKIDVPLGDVSLSTSSGQLGIFGPALRNCARWVQDEFAARGVKDVDVSAWRGIVHSKDEVPQQENHVDCGVFCLSIVKALAEGFEKNQIFEKVVVPLTRRKIALRIVN